MFDGVISGTTWMKRFKLRALQLMRTSRYVCPKLSARQQPRQLSLSSTFSICFEVCRQGPLKFVPVDEVSNTSKCFWDIRHGCLAS